MVRWSKQMSNNTQILSVTADNTLSNDTMTDELASLIAHFGGDLTQMRCLLHVINLVAKTVTKEFDVQDNREGTDDLTTLAEGIDAGDLWAIEEWEGSGDEINDVDGWVDEISLLMANEHARLEGKICPVKVALVKVSEIKMMT